MLIWGPHRPDYKNAWNYSIFHTIVPRVLIIRPMMGNCYLHTRTALTPGKKGSASPSDFEGWEMAEKFLDIWVERKNAYIYQESTQISAVVQPVGQSRILQQMWQWEDFLWMSPQWEVGPIFYLEANITYFFAKSFIFRDTGIYNNCINPLNPELNPICCLLALLGAHHFLHVSRIRVKLLTFRLLMLYIYIYIWSTHSWCF